MLNFSLEAFIIILTYLHAAIDAIQINKNKSINHKLESYIVGILFGLTLLYTKSNIIYACIVILITRIAFFDFVLNILRGLSPFYISVEALNGYSGTKESKWDTIIKTKANYFRCTALILFNILIILKCIGIVKY